MNDVPTGTVTTKVPARLDWLPWSRWHWMIVIVLAQDRRPRTRRPAQGNSKHREVMGGQFDASGGRQVIPRRDATPPEVADSEVRTADDHGTDRRS